MIHFQWQCAAARHATAVAKRRDGLHLDFCCVLHQQQQKLVQKECDMHQRLLTSNNCFKRRSNQMPWPHIRVRALALKHHLSVCIILYILQQLVRVQWLIFESCGSGSWTLLEPFRVCAGTLWPQGLTPSAHLKFHFSLPDGNHMPILSKCNCFSFQSHYAPAMLGEIEAARTAWPPPPHLPSPVDTKKEHRFSSGSSFETFSDVADISVQPPEEITSAPRTSPEHFCRDFE